MANGKADGTVYINTELDTSEMGEDIKSLGKEIEKNTENIGETGKKIGKELADGIKEGIGDPLSELPGDPLSEPLEKQTKGIKERLSALSGSLTKFGGAMSLAVTAPLTALGGKMFNSASDLEENINKVEVAFGNSAEKVKEWAETATESFGLSKNQALEATSLFGDMATSMGLSQENAADMSTTLAGLAGDLASFKNIDVGQAMTALNGVFTGETESLKTLGVVMTETNLEEFADSAGLVYKEMSQAEKVQLRYNYVLDKTKNAQGDYSRTADGAANSMRTLSASMENLIAELGQNLLPIITPIIQGITNIAKKFGEMSPFIQKLIIGIGMVVAAIGPLLTSIGGIISAVTTIGPIIGPMLSSIGAGLGAVAGPIAAVVAVIGVLVAAFKTLWENNEGFRESIIASWERIKEAVSGFSEGILERINSFGFEFGSLTEALSAAWNSFCDILAPIFESTFDVIATVLETVFSVLLQLFDVFRNLFEGNWEEAWEDVKNIFKTVWEGLKKVGESVLNSLLQILVTVAEKIRTKFLAVFERLKTGFKSIWNGIVDFIKGVINKIIGNINSLISGVVAGINAMIDAINGFGFDIPDEIPIIGGKSFSMNIPKITAPQIPYLASGAVIPPNAPFAAVLGDQRNGKNLEAPEGLIRQIIREELANISVNVAFEVEGDPNGIFKVTQKKAREYTKRTGSSAFN